MIEPGYLNTEMLNDVLNRAKTNPEIMDNRLWNITYNSKKDTFYYCYDIYQKELDTEAYNIIKEAYGLITIDLHILDNYKRKNQKESDEEIHERLKIIVHYLLKIYKEKNMKINDFLDLLDCVDPEHNLTIWTHLYNLKEADAYRRTHSIDELLKLFSYVTPEQIEKMHYLYFTNEFFQIVEDNEDKIIKSIKQDIGEE